MATAKLKQKWTSEEEEALCSGVEKHGLGKWKTILSDPQFSSTLANRSNVDLKDKWRNLSASGNCLSSRHNFRTPAFEGVATIPPLSFLEPSSTVPLLEYSGMAGPSRRLLDRRTSPEFGAMIYEALLSMEDPNGSDINAILNFIEERYELPENHQKAIASKLRRLVSKGELEMVGNCYMINAISYGALTSQLEPKTSETPLPTETAEDAALVAVHAISVADNTEHELVEGCREADECDRLLLENEAMLMLAEELHEKCTRDGHVILRSGSLNRCLQG